MGKMGGLKSFFPVTNWLFLIGVLALSGIPPLSVFFSKDLILEQEHLAGFEVLFYVGLIASILTAFYLTRAYCLTFLGTPRLPEKILKSIEEAPKIMLIPVAILAVLAVFGGFMGFAFGKEPILESFLAEVGVTLFDDKPAGNFLYTVETLMSVVGGVLGVLVAAFIYIRQPERVYKPIKFLKDSFYIDEIYWYGIAMPFRKLANFIDTVVEPKVFEGSIDSLSQETMETARVMQKSQSGQVRSYAAWMVLGMSALVAYFVFKIGA